MDEELLADFDSFTAPEADLAPVVETAPIVEAPVVEPISEADPMLSDFDTFTQVEQPQIDPIEQHRPPEVDENTWQDIRSRVSKLLTEYTPLGAIPAMGAELVAEGMQKEGSQVAEAMSVKSRLENIDFAYSDLADTFKAATGDKESEQLLKTKQNKLNDEVVSILDDRGIESYNDNGKLKVVIKDEDGNDTLHDLDDEVLDSVLGGFKASAGEIGGAIISATGGAVQAQRMLPLTATPQQRAVAGTVGALGAGYVGATIGRATDLIRNAISLNKEIDAKEVLTKSLEAGTADIAGTVAVGAIAKGVSKAVAPLGKAFDKAKTLIKQGNLSGAKKQIMKDFDLTDADIDKLYKNVAKDVEYAEDLTGDDLLRAKLTATMQQQPQGLEPLRQAIKKNTKAAIETSKEINMRAREVMNSASQFAKKPSAIGKSVEKYEKAVLENYGEVRSLIDEALPFHKSDLDTASFKPTLDDLNKRVVDPTVKEKLTNLAESLASQKSDTVDDLIGIRQQYNKFYGKNIQHFDTKPDKEALKSIQDTIDAKIDEALNTLPENISKSLKGAFTDAKQKYVKMFKTQDTATYNAIFRKGASESDIANSLIKYSKAADKDLETVLSKLSTVQRTKAEFGVINKMVKDNLAKGEAKAVDFAQLAEDIGTSKEIFKTPEAKQFIKNIEGFNTKFAKDIELQSAALGVTEKTKKNIATSVEGKARMVIASNYFEAFQRLFPSETGRRLSLQKAIEMSLEKSRTPREFFFNASKIKGMPNKDRIALKKAIKEIGEQEHRLKVKAQIEQDRVAKETATKKEKKILTEKEFHKAKWEEAKAERAKEIEAEKKGPSIEESKEAARKAKKKLPPQAQKVKDASVPEIGAEADSEKKAVKNMFAKNTSDKYKGMSKSEIAELDRMDAQALMDEANSVFAKGGDNLAAGLIAGIEKDEDGNITFDPEKFVLGLGGYTAVKALAKNKTIQKEFKSYVDRALTDLENKKGFNYLTGKQSIVDAGKAPSKNSLIVQHNLTSENILHAEDVGGLAVPSLAVTKVDAPLAGFGDITLLGHSNLIKPSRDIKVFGADVYSPRYPQINYSLTSRQQRMIDEDLAPYEAITASREYAEKDGLNALYDNVAFRAKFLDEKGIKVKLPKAAKANTDSMKAYNKYYKKIVSFKSFVDSQQLRFDVDFQKAMIQEYKDADPAMLKALDIGNPDGVKASQELINLAWKRAQKLSSLAEQMKKAGKPDEYAIKGAIREAINKKKLSGELKNYAKKYLKDVGAKETIWNGTDRMGRNKYIEHTLSNVINKLKKDIRGGENFNYGLGTARAKLTPEFKTIKQIQSQKDKLVSSGQFELVKKEMDDKVDEVSDSLKMYYEYDSDAFGYQAEVLGAISEQDLRGYGFKNLPDYVKEEVAELTTALREMPTEYFEVKVLRALDAGEFKLAVIPNGTSRETINLLKKKGLKISKYNPSNKGSREDVIKKAAGRERILFMHPATPGGAIAIGTANELTKTKKEK